ncbi:MAG: phosphoglucosamine mutase [Verrucomicrobia bacterium]|jgi:phosphoglucosamine mutase|nr:phosphoglucosamine mutase [Verrucomicrobiota bacterium]
MNVFGTDGIRDRIDGPALEPRRVYQLGRAVGRWLTRTPANASRHVLIGRDTRASASKIFLPLSKGLHAEGIRIFDGGVCPTPAVANSVLGLDLDLGIVLTASHNPATDNGIKLFGPRGCKLREAQEREIEAEMEALAEEKSLPDNATSPPVMHYDARRHYRESWQKILPEKALLGFRIVLDCANGATCRTSGEILERLGAQVLSYSDQPNGENINAGVGSEYPDLICRETVQNKADLGIAHDGDGDRLILCDRNGKLVDGDAVLAILARGWADQGRLSNNKAVATIMSNLGLDHCLRDKGVDLIRTGVGDRNVYYAMRENAAVLGGESSGHFIALPFLPTGDGLLAALLVLEECIRSGKTLDELASVFQPFPQEKQNLPVRAKPDLDGLSGLSESLVQLEGALGEQGRVLLRYSGTEPKIRLLAEAEDPNLARETLQRLHQLVAEHLPLA